MIRKIIKINGQIQQLNITIINNLPMTAFGNTLIMTTIVLL